MESRTHSRSGIILSPGGKRLCLSCGTPLTIPRRKYCSMICRENLHLGLNRRTGLLRAIQTRYATFYFTESVVILDILPYGEERIFSFILHRGSNRKPIDDFRILSQYLGNRWWEEEKRTNKRYIASRLLLESANACGEGKENVIPSAARVPSVKTGSLVHLQLNRSDLVSREPDRLIKEAFRKQAKRHHPDLGGETLTFRKIHEAYQDLMEWASQPVYVTRRGFKDKWFYDGGSNRWMRPVLRAI